MRTGDVLTPPALEPLPIYEAREDAGALLVRLAPPPDAEEAAHARDDHVTDEEARAVTVAAPSLEGLSLDDVDLTDLDTWEERVPYDWLALLRRDAPVFWQPEVEGNGFWAFTRYDDVVSVSKDWETFSSELGGTSLQDLTDEELEARKSMLDTDPPPHTRMRGLVNKGFTPRVINTYEERIRAPRAGDPRDGVRAGRVRLGRVRCRRDPDVGLLRDHGPAGRGPAADHRARRQDPREHRPGRRRRGVRRRARAP